MGRIASAFRSFFSILFGGTLPDDIAHEFGYIRNKPQPVPKPELKFQPSDGAMQLLGILQRDSRIIDFLMEDISTYTDEQIGGPVRELHDQCRASLTRYFELSPVIDGVEGTFTKLEASEPSSIKLLGNVPASGKVPGGVLRHKGWRAQKVNLPSLSGAQSILMPAEIEVE